MNSCGKVKTCFCCFNAWSFVCTKPRARGNEPRSRHRLCLAPGADQSLCPGPFRGVTSAFADAPSQLGPVQTSSAISLVCRGPVVSAPQLPLGSSHRSAQQSLAITIPELQDNTGRTVSRPYPTLLRAPDLAPDADAYHWRAARVGWGKDLAHHPNEECL